MNIKDSIYIDQKYYIYTNKKWVQFAKDEYYFLKICNKGLCVSNVDKYYENNGLTHGFFHCECFIIKTSFYWNGNELL